MGSGVTNVTPLPVCFGAAEAGGSGVTNVTPLPVCFGAAEAGGSGTVMVTLGCVAPALLRLTERGRGAAAPETSRVRAGSSFAAVAAGPRAGDPPAARPPAAVADLRRPLSCGDEPGVLRPAFGVVPRLPAGAAAAAAAMTGCSTGVAWVACMILCTSSIRAGGTVFLGEKEVGMEIPQGGVPPFPPRPQAIL
jgi:hypothetical protein